jgi:hypothetical protein
MRGFVSLSFAFTAHQPVFAVAATFSETPRFALQPRQILVLPLLLHYPRCIERGRVSGSQHWVYFTL